MISERHNLTPAEIRRQAQEWFDRQVEIISKAHGPAWPEHREWIEDYLRAELRQRLIALGWRPKK